VLDSEQLHEQAIRSARENGFIAYELAARLYAARGFEQIADLYLRNARYGYLRWEGASTRRDVSMLQTARLTSRPDEYYWCAG
jgi:hypothetical protein